MVLLSLKAKLFAFGATVLTGLLFVIRVLVSRNRSLKSKVEKAEKTLQARERVDKIDSELESTFSDLKRAAEKDLESGEVPGHLESPDEI